MNEDNKEIQNIREDIVRCFHNELSNHKQTIQLSKETMEGIVNDILAYVVHLADEWAEWKEIEIGDEDMEDIQFMAYTYIKGIVFGITNFKEE